MSGREHGTENHVSNLNCYKLSKNSDINSNNFEFWAFDTLEDAVIKF